MAPSKPRGALDEGDPVDLTGEMFVVHEDGTVTVRLRGYDYPLTLRASSAHLTAVAGAAGLLRRAANKSS